MLHCLLAVFLAHPIHTTMVLLCVLGALYLVTTPAWLWHLVKHTTYVKHVFFHIPVDNAKD